MKYTHIIWDFNGTLYDDVRESIKVANALLRSRGVSELNSLDEYREAFGFPIIEYYRRIGIDLTEDEYASLAVEWLGMYLDATANCGLCEGVRETLEAVDRMGLTQLILSATEIGMLTRTIQQLGVRQYFSELLALDNIHAHSKTALGISWKNAHNDAKLLFIGDTDHDYEVAKEIGADCILVTSGHQSRRILEATGAVVIDRATEVLKYLD